VQVYLGYLGSLKVPKNHTSTGEYRELWEVATFHDNMEPRVDRIRTSFTTWSGSTNNGYSTSL